MMFRPVWELDNSAGEHQAWQMRPTKEGYVWWIDRVCPGANEFELLFNDDRGITSCGIFYSLEEADGWYVMMHETVEEYAYHYGSAFM